MAEDKFEQAKGNIKETVGNATDNKELEKDDFIFSNVFFRLLPLISTLPFPFVIIFRVFFNSVVLI